jgi:hypothetical protein
MWQSIQTAPPDVDLELAVINQYGTHALAFPCRRTSEGWVKAESMEVLDVHPTHWRPWPDTD